jgi:hypothetical protein
MTLDTGRWTLGQNYNFGLRIAECGFGRSCGIAACEARRSQERNEGVNGKLDAGEDVGFRIAECGEHWYQLAVWTR